MLKLKTVFRECCPPFVIRFFRCLRNDNNAYTGHYESWAEAMSNVNGYDSDVIFQSASEASLKVKHGKAIFERDSVCFYHKEYRLPTLTYLLMIAAENSGELNVLDFGGALGSFYFQHKFFFDRLKLIKWSVVEQQHFVEFGEKEIQNKYIKFYHGIDDCALHTNVDVVLISSVLQYLEFPQQTLMSLSNLKAKYIIFDRTSFVEGDEDRLTIQTVPENIYKASYPAWFFSKSSFEALVAKVGYTIVEEFDCDEKARFGVFKGYLLERI